MDLRLVLNVFTSNVQWNIGSYGIIIITIVASYTVKILFCYCCVFITVYGWQQTDIFWGTMVVITITAPPTDVTCPINSTITQSFARPL